MTRMSRRVATVAASLLSVLAGVLATPATAFADDESHVLRIYNVGMADYEGYAGNG